MSSFLHELGDLARVPFAAVLIEALNTRATGTLQVEHDGGASRIFVREGIPVGSQSFTGFKPLGQILLARGRIDMATLNESLAGMAATGKPQGEVLVELGVLSRAEVDQVLTEQQEGYLSLIASLERGTFRFDSRKAIPDWTRGVRIQPLRAIVQALEKPQAAALVVSALQPVAGGPLALARGYQKLSHAFGWSPGEQRLLDRLGSLTTLDEFFSDPGVPPERARAMLAALLLLGLAYSRAGPVTTTVDSVPGLVVDLADLAGVEIGPATAATPRPSMPPVQAAAPGPARPGPGGRSTPAMGAFATPPPLPTAERPSPPPSPMPAQAHFPPPRSASPATQPAATPPPPSARPQPQRPPPAPSPPQAAAPAPTPPPAAAPAPPAPPPSATPPPPGRRSDPEEAKRRRQRLLQRAMQNMGIGPLASRPPATPGAPGHTPVPSALPTPAPGTIPAGTPVPGTAGEAELRRAFEQVAPKVRGPDLFARLGLERGATRDQVKQAYFKLAKQFHPDRFLSPGLADLQSAVKDLFAALNEAYETLSDDRQRAEWLTRNARGSVAATVSGERAAAAALDFQKGEACLRTRDFQRARGFFEAAVRAHPRADHQAALAWCLWFDTKAADRGRAKEVLAAALKDAASDRAAYTGAMIARDEGDEDRAEHLFRLALKANPSHVEAEREVRLIEARRRKR